MYCLPEERHQIQANAQATALSLSTFLLNVGIGYQVRGIVDKQAVEVHQAMTASIGIGLAYW